MQPVNITFDKYPITIESPEILRCNETNIILLELKNGHSVNIKEFIKKLITTLKCFLFSMKKFYNKNEIVYELVIYKIKFTTKSWGYWGAKHTEIVENKNPWAYWGNCTKEHSINIDNIKW